MNYHLTDESETIVRGEFTKSSSNFGSISKFINPKLEIDGEVYLLAKKTAKKGKLYVHENDSFKVTLSLKHKSRYSLRIKVF